MGRGGQGGGPSGDGCSWTGGGHSVGRGPRLERLSWLQEKNEGQSGWGRGRPGNSASSLLKVGTSGRGPPGPLPPGSCRASPWRGCGPSAALRPRPTPLQGRPCLLLGWPRLCRFRSRVSKDKGSPGVVPEPRHVPLSSLSWPQGCCLPSTFHPVVPACGTSSGSGPRGRVTREVAWGRLELVPDSGVLALGAVPAPHSS